MPEADILKYAALVQNSKGEILLGRKPGKDTWINIGGQCRPGETPTQCLARELKEEILCDIVTNPEPQRFVETPATPALDDPGMTVKIVWFKVTLIGEPIANDELEEVKWIDPTKAGEYKLSPQIATYLIPALA